MMRWISIVTLSIVGMLAGSALSGCSGTPERPEQMPDKTIEQVLNERTAEWMAIPGVEGAAIGIFEGRPCIRVFTSSKRQQVQANQQYNCMPNASLSKAAYRFQAFAKARKLRSYVLSTSSGKQQPGSCLEDK
jgi:hypothetical protein